MSPAEFDDIRRTGNFNLAPGALEVKQFGHDLDEVLALTDRLPDAAAVVHTSVPRSLFDILDHTPVDTDVLSSGTTTVTSELLSLFNELKSPVEHAF